MAFKRRVSPTLVKATTRANKLSEIRPDLVLSSSMTLANYQVKVKTAQAALDHYNGLLTQADLESDQFDDLEKELKDLSERMLTGVATEFGKDSPEYEAAGGVRKSERKKPVRKPKTA
jgi:hypothetical protein